MASNWWGNKTKDALQDCEARLAAALTENNKLREENARLRQQRRPPMVMVGDEDAGAYGYVQSDGGW